MASQRTRPADGSLRSTTQNSIPPSAKRRVEQRLTEYEEFVDDDEDSYCHDPAGEAPAELPIYHSEFLKAASACLKVQPDFLVAAKADKNPHLAAALRSKTQDVLKDYQSKPEPAAVVGKIGQGKSRLVDALLGTDQIAKSGGSGVAGTCVSIIYSPLPLTSRVAYEASIRVIGEETCRDIVRQHLCNVITRFNKPEGSSSLADHQGSDSMIVLKNLFYGYPEFAPDDAIFAFLGYKDDASDTPSDSVQEKTINTCIDWADQRRLKTAAKSPIYPADVTELWCKIAPFANDQTTLFGTELESNATLLVAKIEIFGDSRIPCSIRDCPGLEDINKGRVTKAKNYLQNSKAVIVVEDFFNSTIVAVGQCTGNVSR
ncbi:unnamed protein product [Alternaria alternata]